VSSRQAPRQPELSRLEEELIAEIHELEAELEKRTEQRDRVGKMAADLVVAEDKLKVETMAKYPMTSVDCLISDLRGELEAGDFTHEFFEDRVAQFKAEVSS
jgi:hypothetical protein